MNIEALYQIYSSNYFVTTDTRAIKKDAISFRYRVNILMEINLQH